MQNRRAYTQFLPQKFDDAFAVKVVRQKHVTGHKVEEDLLHEKRISPPFVGELWKATVKLQNLFSFAMENIRLQVVIELHRKRVGTLFDTSTHKHKTALLPNENLEFDVEYLFEQLAEFNFAIILSCQTSDGSDSRRYTYPLDISTQLAVNFRVNRQTLNELLLIEVVVFNATQKSVEITKVGVAPVPMFECIDLNQNENKSVHLAPNLSRAYLFQMFFQQKTNPANQAALVSGNVSISWRCEDRTGTVKSDHQQRDRLNPRMVLESPNSSSPCPKIELALLTIPSKVVKGSPFEIPLEIRNSEDHPLEVFLELDNVETTSMIPYGNSMKQYLGVVKSRETVRASVWYVGLTVGIQAINNMRIACFEPESRKTEEKDKQPRIAIQGKFPFLHFIEVI